MSKCAAASHRLTAFARDLVRSIEGPNVDISAKELFGGA
jgi:hypothetical protein